MKLLVLGGTVFLGRHIVTEALRLGHEVTIFNRGQSNPDLFSGEVEKILGDRETDLSRLKGLKFDACIDPSGFLPGPVGEAVKVLSDSLQTYVFISSISVYPKFTRDMDESGALSELAEDADPTIFRQQDYGALKVLCEAAAETNMPGRVLHVRSGLIVGPYDPTNRFTYWPVRVSQGGDLLVPSKPDLPVQFIDARDQAIWILHMLEKKQTGTYNVTSDWQEHTLSDLLESSARLTGADINPIWVDSDFLTEQKIAPWMGLPLWLPDRMINMSRVSVTKAVAAGLKFRALDATINDTLAWYRSIPEQDWPAGISREKEREVLENWRHRIS